MAGKCKSALKPLARTLLLHNNVHVPSAWNHDIEVRSEFFDSLYMDSMEYKNKCHLLLGDFNTRLHGRYDDEINFLGPHVFGRGTQFLDKQNTIDEEENRTLFCNMINHTDMIHMNSQFDNPP